MFKFDPMSDSGIIWVRFQKCYTKVLCDLYVAFAYLPPSNSTYGKVHGQAIMQKLEKKWVFYMQRKGSYMWQLKCQGGW